MTGLALMTDSLAIGEQTLEAKPSAIELLVARARGGDQTAFEQIVVRCHRRVLATAWRLLGNEDDARDAAQETFLRAYRYLSSYRPGKDFEGWLYRITVNVCRDIGRRRRRPRLVSYESGVEGGLFTALMSEQDVEAEAIGAQERRILMEALGTLSDREREALVLRDLEGMPARDVAKAMGTSAATVRVHICAARAKIKRFRERLISRSKS